MSEKYNEVGPERYYVVSESELKALSLSVWDDATNFHNPGESHPDATSLRDQAEAACRARPVPEWATHFAGPPKDWTNFNVGDETVPVTLLEAIER